MASAPVPGHLHTTLNRWTPVLVLLGVFGAFAVTSSRDYMHIDAHAATVEAWHIAVTGSPWLEGDLTPIMASNPFIGPASNGHVVAQRMMGPVLLGIPFYLVLNSSPRPEDFVFFPGGLAAATFSSLAAFLMFLAIRGRATTRTAVFAALGLAFATPMWTVSADQLWTHTVTQLGLAGATWSASRSRWVIAGLFLALGILGRPHIAVVAMVLGVGISYSERSWRPTLRIGAATASGLIALIFWNRWMFGEWTVGGSYAGRAAAAVEGLPDSSMSAGTTTQLSNHVGFLLSPDRGLLVWSPVLLVLAPALVRAWRDLPSWSRWLALGGMSYTLIQLRLNYFHGGDTFWGYRHALELVTCLTPALAFSYGRAGTVVKRAVWLLLSLQFATMALGAVTFGYWVPIADVWTGNSFLKMWGSHPVIVTVWVTICAGVGLFLPSVVQWFGRRSRRLAGPGCPSD